MWFKEGVPGSRCARPIRKAGEHLGRGLRCSVASARHGGDETDSWAQGVRRGHVLRGLLRRLLGCGGCQVGRAGRGAGLSVGGGECAVRAGERARGRGRR